MPSAASKQKNTATVASWINDEAYVPPIGRQDAKYIIIGEAPGADEVKEKKPFVGRAGKLLDNLLKDAGIDKEDCYITNVCKHRPPDNDFSLFRKKEAGDYLEKSISSLHAEIDKVNPKGIVCLGAEAMSAILGDRRVAARRGFIEFHNNRKVLCTYHPSAILRAINLYPLSLFDLKKLKKEIDVPPSKTERNAVVRPTFEQAINMLKQLQQCEYFTFDIENTDEGIDCIGFADSERRGFTIPFQVQTGEGDKVWVGSYWGAQQEAQIWEEIKILLENKETKKCAQNAFYDCWHLEKQMGIKVANVVHDTMIAAALLNSEFKKDLWTLASLYTDVGFWEDEDETLSDKRWVYCAKDAMITYEIWRKQEDELKELRLTDFFRSLPMSLLPHLIRASIRGVRFDNARRDQLLKETDRELRDSILEFRKVAGEELNYNSYPQILKFYTDRGVKPILNKETKRPSFSAENLRKLDKTYNLPETKHLIRIRELENKKEFLNVKLSEDGRLRCSYNIAGTETGRLSSSEAPDRTGTNLQNWAAENRVLICPDGVFLKCDLAQAENRIVAYLSEDPFMIKAVNTEDIHTNIARMIFNRQDITKKERQLGKKIGHATNYGMLPKRLQEICWEEEQIEISLKEAKGYQEGYHSAFPKIRIWHEYIKSQLAKSSSLTNPFGRRRSFLGFWGPELWREGFAFLPQSTCVDRCNLALIELCGTHGLDARLQTHDEIVFDVTPGEEVATARIIKEVMERPFQIGNHRVSIPVEIKVGDNWYETRDLEKKDRVEVKAEGKACAAAPTI